MTDDIIKQVPYILENPVIIMRSRTVGGRITMFGDVKDASGNMVLAALELNPTSRTGAQIEAIKVASAYGKEGNINNFINKSEILYVDQDKKEPLIGSASIGSNCRYLLANMVLRKILTQR